VIDFQLVGQKGDLPVGERCRSAIAQVAQDRTSRVGQLNADLVPPPGFQVYLQKASLPVTVQNPINQAGRFAVRCGFGHHTAVAVDTLDMVPKTSGNLGHLAIHHRQIPFHHRSFAKLT
jgi:hypothetical protein